MPFPVLKSANGRVQRVVTSREELEQLKAEGYVDVNAKPAHVQKTPEK